MEESIIIRKKIAQLMKKMIEKKNGRKNAKKGKKRE